MKMKKQKLKLNIAKVGPVVKQALKEDLNAKGDITTKFTVDKNYKVKARLISRQKGVLSGIDVFGLVLKSVSNKIKFKPSLKDGQKLIPNRTIARIQGSARDILTAERTALNFLGRLSGIATLTNKFVTPTKGTSVKILDTRKTTPNLRYLEKYAVLCGGGYNHRQGLYDQILIKDNHIEAFRNNETLGRKKRFDKKKTTRIEAIQLILEKLNKKKISGIKIEIEVETLRELAIALKENPDIIMLDNMDLAQIKRAVKLRDQYYPHSKKKKPCLEISGRVTANRVLKLAATGVDMISVGALTHSAKIIDFSLEID